jgi:hypothetical protein
VALRGREPIRNSCARLIGTTEVLSDRASTPSTYSRRSVVEWYTTARWCQLPSATYVVDAEAVLPAPGDIPAYPFVTYRPKAGVVLLHRPAIATALSASTSVVLTHAATELGMALFVPEASK